MKGRGKYKGFIWKSEEQVELCDIEDNAIVFLKDTFIGIFTNLRFVCVNLFNGSSVTWCNRGTYGKIKFKDYNVFKRKNIIVSQNINDYT